MYKGTWHVAWHPEVSKCNFSKLREIGTTNKYTFNLSDPYKLLNFLKYTTISKNVGLLSEVESLSISKDSSWKIKFIFALKITKFLQNKGI